MDKIIRRLNDLALHTPVISDPGLLLSIMRPSSKAGGPELFTQEQLDLLEKKYQASLPGDYRKLLTEFGVFNLSFEYNDEADEFRILGFEGLYHDLYSPITGTAGSGLKGFFHLRLMLAGISIFTTSIMRQATDSVLYLW